MLDRSFFFSSPPALPPPLLQGSLLLWPSRARPTFAWKPKALATTAAKTAHNTTTRRIAAGVL